MRYTTTFVAKQAVQTASNAIRTTPFNVATATLNTTPPPQPTYPWWNQQPSLYSDRYSQRRCFSTATAAPHTEAFDITRSNPQTERALIKLEKLLSHHKKGGNVAFVFDFDGTLADTIQNMCDAVRKTFIQANLPSPDYINDNEAIMLRLNNPPAKAYEELFGKNNAEHCGNVYRSLRKEHAVTGDVKELSYAIKLLEALHAQGIQNIFISSCDYDEVKKIQSHELGFSPFVKAVNGNTGSPEDKPNSEGILKTLTEHKVGFDDLKVIVVGDSTLGTDLKLSQNIHEALQKHGGTCDFIGFGKSETRHLEQHQRYGAHVTSHGLLDRMLKYFEQNPEENLSLVLSGGKGVIVRR